MPILWLTVIANWNNIFVTNEVRVSYHERLDNNAGEHFELDRTGSVKSTASADWLTKMVTGGKTGSRGIIRGLIRRQGGMRGWRLCGLRCSPISRRRGDY
jgi:hypothetical protein